MKRPSSSSYFHQHQHHFFLIPQTLRLVEVLQPPLDIRVYLVAAFSPIGAIAGQLICATFLVFVEVLDLRVIFFPLSCLTSCSQVSMVPKFLSPLLVSFFSKVGSKTF
ncbi:hypothetical protein MtrunA17_Chr2g0312201 [Medicago truncatula]|uniref:Transmembrane protein n=1 Tax=Medicago truncatula TaxID=3880 RepID=A0A396J8L2_MEDTR|nr:hypothetical protein MtrunA17_Chr2g0312201 [Medicago truncatula]